MIFTFDILSWTFKINIYLLIGLIIIVISTLAAIYHKKYTPALWGWTMGAGIYFTQDYIGSLMLGWVNMDTGHLYYITLTYFLIWAVLIIILMGNVIKKGEVVL